MIHGWHSACPKSQISLLCVPCLDNIAIWLVPVFVWTLYLNDCARSSQRQESHVWQLVFLASCDLCKINFPKMHRVWNWWSAFCNTDVGTVFPQQLLTYMCVFPSHNSVQQQLLLLLHNCGKISVTIVPFHGDCNISRADIFSLWSTHTNTHTHTPIDFWCWLSYNTYASESRMRKRKTLQAAKKDSSH